MSYIHSVRTMFAERRKMLNVCIFQSLLLAFQLVRQTQEIKALLHRKTFHNGNCAKEKLPSVTGKVYVLEVIVTQNYH